MQGQCRTFGGQIDGRTQDHSIHRDTIASRGKTEIINIPVGHKDGFVLYKSTLSDNSHARKVREIKSEKINVPFFSVRR